MPAEEKRATKAYIGYCPELKLYRYSLDTGPEQRFSDDELIASMAALEKDGKMAEHAYLAMVTAFARRQPHTKIAVDSAP